MATERREREREKKKEKNRKIDTAAPTPCS